jgi:hypothetical protein
MNAAEYQQLFFSTIQRAPGQPADDYEQVLGASGIPAGYGPGVIPDASMPLSAMTQQIGSDGRIAGRIFLPTATPDDLGYYTHPFSPLRDGETPGSLVWEWRDLGGPPIVTPGASTGDSGGGGLTRDDVQAMIDAALVDVVKVGSTVALRSCGDSSAGIPAQLLSVDGGGTRPDQPLTWQGRTGDKPGPWETLTIEKGQ